MEKPYCFGTLYGKHGVFCENSCVFKPECKVKSKLSGAPAYVEGRKLKASHAGMKEATNLKDKLLMASFNTDIAIIWGLTYYRRMLDRTAPLELADEYEWLLQGEDCYVKERRIDALKEEVVRRKIWDDWDEFVNWASTSECSHCGRKNRLRLDKKNHKCGNCGVSLYD